jgi:hypothetical protein
MIFLFTMEIVAPKFIDSALSNDNFFLITLQNTK